MNDSDNIIVDTATKLFQDLCTTSVVNDAEKGQWPTALWNALEEAGLTVAWVPDTLGGAGAEMADGFAVARVAAGFAAPVPLAETLIAGWLLSRAGLQVPAGAMTVAPVHGEDRIELAGDGKLKGSAHHVPFARNAKHLAVLVQRAGKPAVALVEASQVAIGHGTSLAGEPRDQVSFDGVTPIAVQASPIDEAGLEAMGAAMRSVQMAGALQRILDQSVQYAMERQQFGRPIGKFQAIQHYLAQLAGEVAAAGAAADAAAEALSGEGAIDDVVMSEVATAKVRVGEAAGTGAGIAHQVHGAMGFTYEHTLHHSTRRLWAWRDEFGNEAVWAIRLGRLVAARGADELWPFITRT